MFWNVTKKALQKIKGTKVVDKENSRVLRINKTSGSTLGQQLSFSIHYPSKHNTSL